MESHMDTKWLLSRLEQRGKSIASLSRAVGRDRAAISRIVNGEQPFQLWMTPIIAEELGVTETEVLSRTGELSLPPLSAAPIIPWHSVGAFAMMNAPIEISAQHERLIVPLDSQTLIALKVEGNGMSALYPAGSLIVVDYAQKTLQDNDVGVFAIGDRSLLRRYHVQRKREWLTCESLETSSDRIEGAGQIVGRVVSAPIIARVA